jgi:hypothetical protein
METLGGLFNNHGTIPIPLKIVILHDQVKSLVMGNSFHRIVEVFVLNVIHIKFLHVFLNKLTNSQISGYVISVKNNVK